MKRKDNLRTNVSIVECKDYGKVRARIKKAVDLVGGFGKFIDSGDKVWVKPNIGRPTKELPSITDPRFIAAVIELIKEETNPKEIVVAENPVFGVSDYEAFEESGVRKAVEKAGAKLIPLSNHPHVSTKVPGGKVLKELLVPKLAFETDVIVNLPKWKTHMITGITICVKNFHGVVSWPQRRLYHTDELSQKLVDVLKVTSPKLNIVDGIRGVHRCGPHIGDAIDIGLIVAGADPIAVDAVCSKIMGYEPFDIATTRIGHADGIGIGKLENIDVLGKPLSKIHKTFSLPNQALVGAYKNVDVILGSICLGCRSRIKLALELAQEKGLLDKLKSPVTLVCGVDAQIPEKVDGRLVVAGDCTLLTRELSSDFANTRLNRKFDESRVKGKEYVDGCPVWYTKLVQKMFPENKVEYFSSRTVKM